MTRRFAALSGVAVSLTIALTACGGSDTDTGNDSTQEVLELAKQKFDEAKSVHLTLKTDSKPSSGDAVLGAKGVLTHQPAFEGTVTVVLSGFNAEVPVVAVDDKVFAKLPLTPRYVAIDPTEYGSPDPADFADPEAGISGLLLELEDAKEAGQKREGDKVLTTYTGTLGGELVDPIIPSASKSGTYKTEVGIDVDGRIITLRVTGDFFAHDGAVTYDLAFDQYDENVTISAP